MGEFFELPFIVMKISGNAEKLFNGIASNTNEKARNAFLDVYGKIAVVFYQKFSGNEVIIAFNKKFRERLEKHLANFLKLNKSKMEETGMKAFLVTSGIRESGKIKGIKAGAEKRGIEKIGGIKIPEKNSFILLAESKPEGMQEMSEKEFERFRLENGISMQGKEFDSEMIMNTDWDDAVSFSKGCFLGQEIVARITQRGKPPKRLVRIAFEQEPGEKMPFIEVRSKAFSDKLGKWIAYCSVPNEEFEIPGGEMLG